MKTLKLLTLMLIALTVLAQPVAADPLRYNVGIIVDGKTVKCDPVAYFVTGENRTIVPIRFVAEALGYAVGWDNDSRTVTLTKGANAMQLQIDSTSATVNGSAKKLDAAARIEQSRTFVPLRFVAENFGASVEWNQPSMTVVIKTTVAADDMRSDFRTILQMYPGKTKVGGRNNSLYYANSGTPGTFNCDIFINNTDNLLQAYTFDQGTYDAIEKMLTVYFPTEHDKAFQAVKSAQRKAKDYTFDGKPFWVGLTSDPATDQVDGIKMSIPAPAEVYQ